MTASKPNAIGALTIGGSASVTNGTAELVDGFHRSDAGRLALTTQRLVYIGAVRADDIDLAHVLETRAANGLVDVAHAGRHHQERFAVENADLIAQLIDVAARRRQRSA